MTKIIIDLDNLAHNLEVISKKIALNDTFFVVKANAYGHDLVMMSKYLHELHVSNLAVATLAEAYKISKVLDSENINILIMGISDFTEAKKYQDKRFIYTVQSYVEASAFSKLMGKVSIKINTGFNRLGISENIEQELNKIKAIKGLNIHSVFSHLRLVNQESDFKQISLFDKYTNNLQLKRHLYDSIALFRYANTYDYARVGGAMYGLISDDLEYLGLKALLSLTTSITNIISLDNRNGFGYDTRTEFLDIQRIAVLPVGYGDGYKRNLVNKSYVIINQQRCLIVAIFMDQMIIDVSKIVCSKGDIVELISENISVATLAKLADTNKNDIVASLMDRLPRIYIKNNHVVNRKDYYGT